MTRCSVLECKNNSGKRNLRSGVSYHRFPKDPHINEEWITATGRINWMPTKSSCICSEHFAENDIIITKKGYRYINPDVLPTKKIMSYQDEKITSTYLNLENILEEPGPSSESPTKTPYISTDQLQNDPLNILDIKPDDNIIMKSTEASSANKTPTRSLSSTARKNKLIGMLRWTRSKLYNKDLKIKRLQAQNRRLKQRLECMKQLLRSVNKKFGVSNENLECP